MLELAVWLRRSEEPLGMRLDVVLACKGDTLRMVPAGKPAHTVTMKSSPLQHHRVSPKRQRKEGKDSPGGTTKARHREHPGIINVCVSVTRS